MIVYRAWGGYSLVETIPCDVCAEGDGHSVGRAFHNVLPDLAQVEPDALCGTFCGTRSRNTTSVGTGACSARPCTGSRSQNPVTIALGGEASCRWGRFPTHLDERVSSKP